jgi:hypothetical protein
MACAIRPVVARQQEKIGDQDTWRSMMVIEVGKRITFTLIPPDEAATRSFVDGPIEFGVEYRLLDTTIMEKNFPPGSPELAAQPQGGYDETGAAIHVMEHSTKFECLRFDMFDKDPHYHYNFGDHQILVGFDTDAHGDMQQWVIPTLRMRLAGMLRKVGKADLAQHAESSKTIAATLDAVAAEMQRAVGSGRNGAR